MTELLNPKFNSYGYIQIYTGPGKGKTTASLGLALRAMGHGWKVEVLQFLKSESAWHYGEITSLLKHKDQLNIQQFGCNMVGKYNEADRQEIIKGWIAAEKLLRSKELTTNLVVLDELNHCIKQGVIPVESVISALKAKHDKLEVVITGRDAHPALVEVAHLVSRIEPVKHYYDTGVMAREGIEW